MSSRRSKTPKSKRPARAAGSRRDASAPGVRADWLARALSRAGVLPLLEAEHAIREGRVRIGTRTVRQPLAPVPAGESVWLDGRRVLLDTPTWVLAFNKPPGLVTAGSDPEGVGTVFDALARVLASEHRSFGWHAVGRLDRNTTGLLLFTNDPRLVAHATSPSTHLPKRYIASVLGRVDEAKLETLRRGLLLDDLLTRPAGAVLREPGVVALTLTEGRHHQVKRMLGALGLPVTRLHREAIGEVVCDVAEGQYRLLNADEVRIGLGFPG